MNNRTRNILRNVGFLLSVPVIIGAFVFAVSENKHELVQGLEVLVLNPELGFVVKQDVEHALSNANVVFGQSKTEELDVAALENKINENPWVKKAEVYLTANNNVKVKLIQHEPKLRVQRTDSTANGYYLDENGFMIPLSRSYYPDVPILTAERPITSINQRKELVSLAQFVEQDTFWQATISQINLDKNNDIELVSLIGDASIRFGNTENMEDKFFRVFQFYKKGIYRINWDNVKELDVRFAKQVVCKRYHKEKQIEESKAPSLYKKNKTQSILSKPKNEQTASVKTVVEKKPIIKKETKTTALIKEKPKAKEKKIVAKEVPKKDLIKKSNTPVVSKPIKEKESVSKIEKPTPKKKQKEIIINTEPLTSKKTTN